MQIEALDVVKEIVEEHCKSLYWTDVLPSGLIPDSEFEFVVLGREDNAWTQWVICFYDHHFILCKDETFNNPSDSRGVRPVEKLLGKPVTPILIHDDDALERLVRLLKKLDVLIQ